jgi:hypothetical protein
VVASGLNFVPFGTADFGKGINRIYKRLSNRLKENTSRVTLNQRVLGSSPSAPTIENNDLGGGLGLVKAGRENCSS